MQRPLLGLLAVTAMLACTDAGDAKPPADPPADRTPVTETPPAQQQRPTLDPAAIDALALNCDGEALAAMFATLDTSALTTLAESTTTPSAGLLARFEAERRFTDGSLDPAAVSSFVAQVTEALGQAPPRWWVEQLGSARLREGDESGPPYYDVGLSQAGDRRGPWVSGPGTTQVRPGVAGALSGANGKLSFDLSLGRVELGPLPSEVDAAIELARGRAGSTIYYASFNRGSGGFRFPLHAIRSDSSEQWRAEVCGPDRKVLGGKGYLTVEIVVLQPPPPAGQAPGAMMPSPEPTAIAVFTAESHGVALELFDPQTGDRTLAWSSDFWFARATR